MSIMGQKEAVVQQVLAHLPTFQKYIDNAILKLSNTQLEAIKTAISTEIILGNIEYSKDKNNFAEVRTYARSMVMNHLKKAKALNGGHSFLSNPSLSGTTAPRTIRVKERIAPKGVNPDLLPEELKEFVKSLV